MRLQPREITESRNLEPNTVTAVIRMSIPVNTNISILAKCLFLRCKFDYLHFHIYPKSSPIIVHAKVGLRLNSLLLMAPAAIEDGSDLE